MAVDRLVWRAEPRPEILPRVLAAEEGSFHPAADAIRAYAAENGVSAEASPEEVRDLSGQGRSALFEGAELRVGARSLFRDPFDPKDPRPNESAVWFGAQGRAEGCLLLADRLRPDAAQVMAAMRSRGYTAEILSGDRQEVCHWAAAELGVEAARGEATLDEKVEHVRALQEEGLEVAFVGDGTNDALAMREAATSVALARSTDEALAAAGFVVLHGSLSGLPELFATGRKLARVIRSNYAWAFAFNAVFIPVAAAGKLVPLAAMLLMLASSTAVLLNSLRLRRR